MLTRLFHLEMYTLLQQLYETTTSQGMLVRAGRRDCTAAVQGVGVCICILVSLFRGGEESAVDVNKLDNVANEHCIHLKC